MIWRIIAVCYLFANLPSLVFGQDPKVDLKAEEAAIRRMIAANDKAGTDSAPRTDDRIMWSGPFKRPWTGSQRGETFPGTDVAKRKNSKRVTAVERVDVA